MLNKKRKIAFIHDEFPGGGGERVTMDVAEYLSSFNYEVFVFVGKYSIDKVSLSSLKFFTVIELPERYVEKSREDAASIIKYVKELDIKILISVGREMLYINEIQKETHCKYVYALHSIPFWEIEVVIDRARRRGMTSLLAKLEWYLISYPKLIWFKVAYRTVYGMYKTTYSVADRYTVLCDKYKDEMVKKLKLVSRDNKIRVIPNSEKKVECINFAKKKQLLFVGRMTHLDKRVDRLIDIWQMIYKKVPDYELILVGDGEEREKLEKRVKHNQLERIRFDGFSNNMSQYYRDASVLCLVSTFEGWPLCLTEAQANAVVPIAFDCSAGVRHILSPSGVNGFLIPPFDLEVYAKILVQLLGDTERLNAIRRNVLRKSEEYVPEIVGKRWMDLFEELYLLDVPDIPCHS